MSTDMNPCKEVGLEQSKICKISTEPKKTINRFNIYYDSFQNHYVIIDCIDSNFAQIICECKQKENAITICKLLNF